MNNQYGLTTTNLLRTLPDALKSDKGMVAVATVIADELTRHLQSIDKANLYSRIDELPEDLLDIMAKDFKVDWWDGEYTIEEKRATLKNHWRVHKILGTKAAVEMAISAIYPDTQVSEWFEYGGEPFHFRLLVDATYESVDREKHARVLERINFYKNLRSVLDEVEYFANSTAYTFVGVAIVGEEIIDGAEANLY